MSTDHPHVFFPPPLLFVAGFLLGLSFDRLWPLSLVTPGAPLLAWTLVAFGIALGAWALATFWRARTGILPHHPATELLDRGPYRFSRNPMYVALSLAYAGLALWVGTLWPLLVLPLVLWALWYLVIRREEAYLTRAFGTAYTDYTRRVRRWL